AIRSAHVLLAEDVLVNQKVACRLLELRGHRVTAVNNGREAVAALEAGHFDCVLMGVQMPGMDGIEAAAAIRPPEPAIGGRVPIIAMPAHALKGDREQCVAAGMDGYITKPIQAETLYQAVEGFAPAVSPTSGPPSPAPEAVMDWDAAVRRLGGRADLLRQ